MDQVGLVSPRCLLDPIESILKTFAIPVSDKICLLTFWDHVEGVKSN